MYFLNNLKNCLFARHPCSITVSAILRGIRKSDWVTEEDTIVVQAVLELKRHGSDYGPFSVVTGKTRSGAENVRVYIDGNLLAELLIEGCAVIINYLREDPQREEELCAMANALVMIENKDPDGSSPNPNAEP